MRSKFIVQILLLVIVSTLFNGCFDPPEFQDEPIISFNDVTYISREGSDSLILTFDFQDGDGDIGLRNDNDENPDKFPPFHDRNYIIDNSNPARFVTFSGSDYEFPWYMINEYDNDPVFFSDTDNRPDYNCRNFQYDSLPVTYGDSLAIIVDTLYVVENEFNKNLYVTFYRKIQGQYRNINEELSNSPQCQDFFNARFPIFDEDNLGRALSGSISYAMISTGFEATFRNDSIMIEFYIYDRALNKSNVVRSPDFLLADVTKN